MLASEPTKMMEGASCRVCARHSKPARLALAACASASLPAPAALCHAEPGRAGVGVPATPERVSGSLGSSGGRVQVLLLTIEECFGDLQERMKEDAVVNVKAMEVRVTTSGNGQIPVLVQIHGLLRFVQHRRQCCDRTGVGTAAASDQPSTATPDQSSTSITNQSRKILHHLSLGKSDTGAGDFATRFKFDF